MKTCITKIKTPERFIKHPKVCRKAAIVLNTPKLQQARGFFTAFVQAKNGRANAALVRAETVNTTTSLRVAQ